MPKTQSLMLAALIGGTLLVPGPAAAEPAGKKKDPNEVVCRKEEVLGSRLQTTKICKTRAEWAEETRENRGNIERAQVQRGTAGN
ncbi:hypothetical protein [Sphingopyxis sp.]|uniref:hypothetical protein n=1 Tax=Sphingopyxis sp. TaxID=1908224 RepID=UPI003D0C69D2